MQAPTSSNGPSSSMNGNGRRAPAGYPSSAMGDEIEPARGQGNGARAVNGQGRPQDEAADDIDEIGPARRRKARNLQNLDEIPKVRDETGERVREQFEIFLKEYVFSICDILVELARLTLLYCLLPEAMLKKKAPYPRHARAGQAVSQKMAATGISTWIRLSG